MRQACEGERGLRERDETDDVVIGEQRGVGVCLRAKRSAWVNNNNKIVFADQSKSLLAVFIKYDTQSFQIDNSRSFAKLTQETLNGIDMYLRLHLPVHQLIECDDRVSYFFKPFNARGLEQQKN